MYLDNVNTTATMYSYSVRTDITLSARIVCTYLGGCFLQVADVLLDDAAHVGALGGRRLGAQTVRLLVASLHCRRRRRAIGQIVGSGGWWRRRHAWHDF